MNIVFKVHLKLYKWKYSTNFRNVSRVKEAVYFTALKKDLTLVGKCLSRILTILPSFLVKIR